MMRKAYAILIAVIMTFTMMSLAGAAVHAAGADVPDDAPFLEISCDKGAPISIKETGDYVDYYGTTAPLYLVTVPEGAETALVTFERDKVFANDSEEIDDYDGPTGTVYGYSYEELAQTGYEDFPGDVDEEHATMYINIADYLNKDNKAAGPETENDFFPVCGLTFEYAKAEEDDSVEAPFIIDGVEGYKVTKGNGVIDTDKPHYVIHVSKEAAANGTWNIQDKSVKATIYWAGDKVSQGYTFGAVGATSSPQAIRKSDPDAVFAALPEATPPLQQNPNIFNQVKDKIKSSVQYYYTVVDDFGAVPHDHEYGDPTWTWADDNTSCNAVFTCGVCGKKETVNATIEEALIKEATETTAGKKKLTAKAAFQGNDYEDTKEVTIPANLPFVIEGTEFTVDKGVPTKSAAGGRTVGTGIYDKDGNDIGDIVRGEVGNTPFYLIHMPEGVIQGNAKDNKWTMRITHNDAWQGKRIAFKAYTASTESFASTANMNQAVYPEGWVTTNRLTSLYIAYPPSANGSTLDRNQAPIFYYMFDTDYVDPDAKLVTVINGDQAKDFALDDEGKLSISALVAKFKPTTSKPGYVFSPEYRMDGDEEAPFVKYPEDGLKLEEGDTIEVKFTLIPDNVVKLVYGNEQRPAEKEVVPATKGKLTLKEADVFTTQDNLDRPKTLVAYTRSVQYRKSTSKKYEDFTSEPIDVSNGDEIYIQYHYEPKDYDVLIDDGGGTYDFDPLRSALYDRKVTINGKEYYQGRYDIMQHATAGGQKYVYNEDTDEYDTFPASLLRPTPPAGYVFEGWELTYYDEGFSLDAAGNATVIPASPSSPGTGATVRATSLGNGRPEMLGQEYIAAGNNKRQPVYGHVLATAKYTNNAFVIALPKGDESMEDGYQDPDTIKASERKGFSIGFLGGTEKTIEPVTDENVLKNFTKCEDASYDFDKYNYYAIPKTNLFQFTLMTAQGYKSGDNALTINGEPFAVNDKNFGVYTNSKMYSLSNKSNVEERMAENQALADKGKDGVIVIDINEDEVRPLKVQVRPVVYGNQNFYDKSSDTYNKIKYTGHEYVIHFMKNGEEIGTSTFDGTNYSLFDGGYVWGDKVSVKITEKETGDDITDLLKVYTRKGVYRYAVDGNGNYPSYDKTYWWRMEDLTYEELNKDENGEYGFYVRPALTKSAHNSDSNPDWFWILDRHVLEPVGQDDATCEKDGVKAHFKCKYCGKRFLEEADAEKVPEYPETDESLKLEATGHDYGAPEYKWNADNTKVTATRVCRNDPKHVETETQDATSEVIKAATYKEAGEITYTSADFENKAFEKQEKTESIPKLTKKKASTAKPVLVAKGIAKGKKAVNLSWNRVSGADRYVIYMSRCNYKGKTVALKKVRTVNGKTLKWTRNKLKKNTVYKFYVVAQKKSGSRYKAMTTSKICHFFTGNVGGKYTNPKSLKLNRTSLTLQKGKSAAIKASVNKVKKGKKLAVSHAPKLRYISNNPSVATVTAKGKVTARSKGTAVIYVQTINGIWKTCKVTVK